MRCARWKCVSKQNPRLTCVTQASPSRNGEWQLGRLGATGVCDSDTFVVIVASVALTDSFPKEPRGRKRAEHTFPSIFVRHFSEHLSARASPREGGMRAF